MEIFDTTRVQWRRSAAKRARCPYSMFEMRHGEVISPRGIAFHPKLVEGPSANCTFAECKGLVEGTLREILDSFKACRPVFYLGATTDLLWRWMNMKDDRGNKCGHAWSPKHRWWAQVALYLTESGDHCANMEEYLIAIFKRYTGGRCQNASDRALRVTRSAEGRHWVYVCLPHGLARPPAPALKPSARAAVSHTPGRSSTSGTPRRSSDGG